MRDLHRAVRVQVQLRRGLLGDAQPAEVVLEAQSGWMPGLHADLGRAVRDRVVHAADELLAVVLVGVRGALPAPKPQNAQPTMQTLETLMLRLTTNVTVSPASSARSSSAAWRMSSIASGRLSANSASSSSAHRARARSRARSIVPAARRWPPGRGAG